MYFHPKVCKVFCAETQLRCIPYDNFHFFQTLRIKHVYINVCFVCEMKYSTSLHVLASNLVFK